MGDRAKQKEAFQKLLQVPFDMENEDKYKDLEVRDVLYTRAVSVASLIHSS